MKFEQIIVTTGPTYEIMLNTPEKENRLTNQSMREIMEALDNADADPKCHAVIFCAAGDVFCFGGGQIKDHRKQSSLDVLEFGKYFMALHTAFGRCSKPVICAVEAEAIGGGFSLIEACDLAVAADDALISICEMAGGLPPAMGMAGLFNELPKKVVMELGLLSKKFTSKEALDWGMLNRVVPRDQVMAEARKMAAEFNEKNPTSIAIFKEMFRRMGQNVYEQRMESAEALLVSAFKSANGFEVLNAKEEHREPHWIEE